MAVNLAEAYVDIVPSTGNLAKMVKGQVDPIFDDAGRRAGTSMVSNIGSSLVSGLTGYGDRVVSFVSGWFTRAAKLGAIAWGATFGGALLGGFNRLKAIDDAEAKLRGLGHSAESVQVIMDSALASVKGTAFGLGDAATIAASAVAAGIEPGKELTRTLSLTGDAAAIAGVSLGEMGSVFNKIAANQKLTTMELNQLQDRGIPVLQWLQEEYGVTAEKAREMVTKGKVDFETFQNLIEKNIGGAALAMGDSFSGAFANMRAAFSRFGAAILKPFFDAAAGGFAAVTGWVDKLTERVKPLAEAVGGEIVGAFIAFGNAWKFADGDITSSGLPGLAEKLAYVVKDLATAWQFFVSALRGGVVFTDAGSPIVEGLGDLYTKASQLGGWLHSNRDAIRSFFEAFVPAAGAVTGLAMSFSLVSRAFALITAATPIGIVMALATALVYAWQNSETFREVVTSAFQTILTVVGPLIDTLRSMLSALFGGDGEGSWLEVAGQAWDKIREVITSVLGWFGEHVLPTLQSAFDAIAAIFTVAANLISEIWTRWGDRIVTIVADVANHVKGLIEAALAVLRGIFEVFAGLFTGDWSRLWEGIKTIVTGVWGAITNYLGVAWDLLKLHLTLVWATIRAGVTLAWNAIKDAIVSAFQAAWERVKKIAQDIKDAVLEVLEFVARLNPFQNRKTITSSIPGLPEDVARQILGAPTLHTGGRVPQTPSGEFLAVLQSGEHVLSRQQVQDVEAGGAPTGMGGPLIQVGEQHFHNELDAATVARLWSYEFAGAVG